MNIIGTENIKARYSFSSATAEPSDLLLLEQQLESLSKSESDEEEL